MEKREQITLSYGGNNFSFFVEPTMMEQQSIKQIAAELLGGLENYSKLIALSDTAFLNHLKLNREKYGSTGYKEKVEKLKELGKAEDNTEFDVLYQEIYNNQFYLQFLNLTKEQTKVEKYAALIVLCSNNPGKVDFRQSKEEYLQGLIKEVETKLQFFRDQYTKTEGADS